MDRAEIGVGGGGFLLVEVAVAVTCGAFQDFESAVFSAGHELTAAVGDVAADVGGVVLEALTVSGGDSSSR